MEKQIVEFYQFFNATNENPNTITSSSLLVGMFGKSLSSSVSTGRKGRVNGGNKIKLRSKLTDLSHVIETRPKTLLSVPIHHIEEQVEEEEEEDIQIDSELTIQKNKFHNQYIQHNIAELVKKEEKAEITLGSKGFVFVEKEDSEEYYHNFKY